MSTDATCLSAIDKLVIESEVRRLLAAYVHNLDYGKVDANAELLAAAKFNIAGTIVEGRNSIAQFLRNNLQYHVDDTPRTWHSVSNVLIDVASATAASSFCYFTVHQELPGLPLQPIVTGRYIRHLRASRRGMALRIARNRAPPVRRHQQARSRPGRNRGGVRQR
ncbi:nuclear transport factor 2 family protein [Novosphingobium resinovorum]|uniref:nuclear transport factor 2 family protein n=1 Tax=Novosphingobium resinovorum TaxID=158500 RepID=UPI000A8DFC3A|nr:nuclear transport factor 2 family protein [Novosphingobium resinovorum]